MSLLLFSAFGWFVFLSLSLVVTPHPFKTRRIIFLSTLGTYYPIYPLMVLKSFNRPTRFRCLSSLFFVLLLIWSRVPVMLTKLVYYFISIFIGLYLSVQCTPFSVLLSFFFLYSRLKNDLCYVRSFVVSL